MNEEQIFEKLISKEIAVKFSNRDSFRIFYGFLTSKGILCKNPPQYYWEKYKESLCVTISDAGNFKCGTVGFYEERHREIFLYDKKPYIVDML